MNKLFALLPFDKAVDTKRHLLRQQKMLQFSSDVFYIALGVTHTRCNIAFSY